MGVVVGNKLGGPRRCGITSGQTSVQIRNDRLGTLVRNLSQSFRDTGSWEDFFRALKDRFYLSLTIGDINHPAAKLLQRWREEGISVNTSSPPWSADQENECIH